MQSVDDQKRIAAKRTHPEDGHADDHHCQGNKKGQWQKIPFFDFHNIKPHSAQAPAFIKMSS